MSTRCPMAGCTNERMRVKSRGGKWYYQDRCRQHHGERVRTLAAEKGGYAGQTRRKTRKGYVLVLQEGEWVEEHKLVMEQMIGRPLRPGEEVRHINRVRDDNRSGNLELWVGGIRYGQPASEFACPNCGCRYLVKLQPLDPTITPDASLVG